MAPDPMGLDGGMNIYVYVRNNSINLIDPLGLIDRLPRNFNPRYGNPYLYRLGNSMSASLKAPSPPIKAGEMKVIGDFIFSVIGIFLRESQTTFLPKEDIDEMLRRINPLKPSPADASEGKRCP